LQVLGVEKGASINQITKAYRILALRYHPDRNLKDAPTGEKFKEISTAYAILSDPNKRRRYDLSGGDTSEMFDDSTESLDLENLNSLQKVVFAIITRFGPNFQTQVNAETLIKA
ncbi:chaperone protein dnaj 16, partial [Nannochloropsis gaditana CCMP526]|uniref:chaperone protein dnaj 16 n=1 Tax=Nannochloropsis gaditana (strain CCMP526) TaxID=1093141 RepID=UPI00029F7FE5